MMKFSIRSVAMATLMACSAVGAMAAPVSAAVPAGFVDFSDNSAERLIDRNSNGTLDVGDSLRGIFSIDNITGGGGLQTQIGGSSPYNELTGIFQTVVLSKTFVGVISGVARYDYTFGFDSLFGEGAGVVGVLYEDSANNFARIGCGSFAACEATATGGSVWATVGLGALGGFWSASAAAEAPGVGANLPLNTPLGTFGMGLDFITDNTGIMWNKVECFDSVTGFGALVDVCGQGGILASGRSRATNPTNTPYDVFDNVDFTMNRVPEPGSLALVGLALAGLGALRRKQES